MSDTATWQRLLEDDDALKKADPAWLAEQRERWPWFTAIPWLQARREVLLQGHSTEPTLRQAAAWSGERARLKAWLSGALRMPPAMPAVELPAVAESLSGFDTPTQQSPASKSEEESDGTTEALELTPEPHADQHEVASPGDVDLASLPKTDSPAMEEKESIAIDSTISVPQPSDSPSVEESIDSPNTAPSVDEPAETGVIKALGGVESASDGSSEEDMPLGDPTSASAPSTTEDMVPGDPAPASDDSAIRNSAPSIFPAEEPFSPQAGERHGFSDWLRRFHAADSASAEPSAADAKKDLLPTKPSSHTPAMPSAQNLSREPDTDSTGAQSPRFDATEDFDALDGLIARQRRRTAASRAREHPPLSHVPAGEEDFPGPLTETWARILADQGKTPEAIAVYEALGLRQPEKSAFFAARIQELKAR